MAMTAEAKKEYMFRYYRKKKNEGTWKTSYKPVSEEQKTLNRQKAKERYKNWLQTEEGQNYLENHSKNKRKYETPEDRIAAQRERILIRQCNDLDFVLQNRIYSIRHKCKKNDIPFDIDFEYLKEIYTGECAYLGVPLELRNSQDKNGYNLSIDRIIPELGYVKGNIKIISNKANLMKANATLEELMIFAKNILRIYGEKCQS